MKNIRDIIHDKLIIIIIIFKKNNNIVAKIYKFIFVSGVHAKNVFCHYTNSHLHQNCQLFLLQITSTRQALRFGKKGERKLSCRLVPLNLSVKSPLRGIQCPFPIGSNKIIGWVFWKFRWHGLPVQARLPLGILHNLQYLLNHYPAPFGG